MSLELWIFCRKQPPAPSLIVEPTVRSAEVVLHDYSVGDDWNTVTLGSFSAAISAPQGESHWLMRLLPAEKRAQVKHVLHFWGMPWLESFAFIERALAPRLAEATAGMVLGPDGVLRDEFAGGLVSDLRVLVDQARAGELESRAALCTLARQGLADGDRILVGEALVECLLDAKVMERKMLFDALLELRYADGADRIEAAYMKDGTVGLFARRLAVLRRHSELRAA